MEKNDSGMRVKSFLDRLSQRRESRRQRSSKKPAAEEMLPPARSSPSTRDEEEQLIPFQVQGFGRLVAFHWAAKELGR